MDSLDIRLKKQAPLWGRWEIGSRLYRSAGCCVYNLENKGDGFPCVVKVVTILGQGDELEMRLNEAKDEIVSLQRLRGCAAVVALYDEDCLPLYENGELVGWDLLLRMERLDCLAELLKEEKSLSVSEIRVLAKDIASALNAAHSKGIIHRDVKPSNIYKTKDGRFQLGDFGSSRRARAGILETMTGTAAYMAPEVARGNAYDSRADLYSLGIVLYQLLNNGQLPLCNEDATLSQRESAISKRWDGAKLPFPGNGDIKLKKLVLKLCRPDPGKRFHSAKEFISALDQKKQRIVPAIAVSGWLLAAALIFVLMRSGTQMTIHESKKSGRYEVIKASMTWEDARIYCESRGGCLASISNRAEMDEVTALLESAGIRTAWLGADNRNSSGGFQWLDGKPFEFAVWAVGEPNNYGGNEHFLMLYQKAGQGWVWNDSSEKGLVSFDQDSCGFVCEWGEDDG